MGTAISLRDDFDTSLLRALAKTRRDADQIPRLLALAENRDGSSRGGVARIGGVGLQMVHHWTNPRYHRVIEAFLDLTGVPMVLNTSFNENEPIVCRPEKALDCFLRTKMDALVMENTMLVRRTKEQQG